MSTTKRWVPAKFWDDHADRRTAADGSDGIATVIRSTGSRVLIEGTAGQLDALRSDAAYYCDPAAFDEVDLPPGLRRSAAATIRALYKNQGNPPAGMVPAGLFGGNTMTYTNTRQDLDALTSELTAFASFAALATDNGRSGSTYCPTLRADIDPRYTELADAYDAHQIAVGSAKRAFRG